MCVLIIKLRTTVAPQVFQNLPVSTAFQNAAAAEQYYNDYTPVLGWEKCGYQISPV